MSYPLIIHFWKAMPKVLFLDSERIEKGIDFTMLHK